MLFIGIDVSKLTFDVAYLLTGKYVNAKFSNDQAGFKAFIQHLKKHNSKQLICLEATGVYSFSLATFLAQKSLKIIVVNPIATHAFFKMEMGRNKTDKADAQLISRYCEHIFIKGDFDKRVYIPKSDDYEALQRLVTRLDQLEKSKTQENNRLEASCNKQTTRSMNRLIKFINTEIKTIKATISVIIKANESLNEQVKLLTSIKGIGDRTHGVFWLISGILAFLTMPNKLLAMQTHP
jgi:transposase